MPNVLRCEIKLWRGYLKCQLYAEAAAGESVLGTSPYFRLKDPNTPTEEAEGHLAELIEALEKRGWQLTASGATWYRHRLEKLQQPNELD